MVWPKEEEEFYNDSGSVLCFQQNPFLFHGQFLLGAKIEKNGVLVAKKGKKCDHVKKSCPKKKHNSFPPKMQEPLKIHCVRTQEDSLLRETDLKDFGTVKQIVWL